MGVGVTLTVTLTGSLHEVAKLLKTAEPATRLGLSAFNSLHDSLVTAPMYKRVIDTTVAVGGYATTTNAYK